MSVHRNLALAAALACLAAPAAFAQSTAVFVGGEIGWIDRPVQSSLTREQVVREFLRFRANPVDASGGRYVGGEAGYVPGPLRADSPKPNPVKTPAERRQFQEDYPA